SIPLDDAGLAAAAEIRGSQGPAVAADLRRCLATLNEKYRTCVTLIYLHGMSYEELALMLAAPVGTVKSWAHRAMHELGICMGKR
ncbi:MAG: RNA polymerase sigma factor, partial [Methylocapsa sp.]|nr:RNA polymerase sigma factor [Methylocapsa sp.]